MFDIEEMVGSRSGLSCAVERNVARSHIVERGLVGMSWVEREEERGGEERGGERKEERGGYVCPQRAGDWRRIFSCGWKGTEPDGSSE